MVSINIILHVILPFSLTNNITLGANVIVKKRSDVDDDGEDTEVTTLDNLTGELQPISVTPKRSKSLINLTPSSNALHQRTVKKNLKHLHQLERY